MATTDELVDFIFKRVQTTGYTELTRKIYEEPYTSPPQFNPGFVRQETLPQFSPQSDGSDSGGDPSLSYPPADFGPGDDGTTVLSGIMTRYYRRTPTAVSGASGSFYLAELRGGVPFNYDPSSWTYEHAIYNNSGTRISYTDGNWISDIQSGVITFFGTFPDGIDDANPPLISFYGYSGDTLGDITAAQWGHLASLDQDLGTTDSPTFAGLTLTDQLGISNGTAANPAIMFSSDTNTGIFRSAENNIDLSAGGTSRFTVSATSIDIKLPTDMNNNSLTGVGTITANAGPVLGFGGNYLDMNLNEIQRCGDVQVEFGSVADPSFTFTNDTDTGIYRVGDNNLGVTCGNSLISDFSSSGLDMNGLDVTAVDQIFVADGTNAAPSVTFTSDTNTGIYRVGDNNIGFATAGVLEMSLTSSRLQMEQQIDMEGNDIIDGGDFGGNSLSVDGGTRIYADYTDDATLLSTIGGGTPRINLLYAAVAANAAVCIPTNDPSDCFAVVSNTTFSTVPSSFTNLIFRCRRDAILLNQPAIFTPRTQGSSGTVEGTIIYNSATNKLNFYTGSAWEVVTSV